MKFTCTGEISQCLECPLPDCIRGTEKLKGKKNYNLDRKKYYKDWYKKNREHHLAKVKNNPKYVEKWGK